MRYFPVFLDLAGRSCLVVGGGDTAAAKARLLRRAGAQTRVVAPVANAEISELAAGGQLRWEARPFAAADVDGTALVYAATGNAETDDAVAAAARAAGVPVDAVDRPASSSFITPAMVDRDPLLVAISSAGAAPVLARRIRADLESRLPPRLGRLAAFAGRFRGAVKASIETAAGRRRFWDAFFAGPLARRVLAGEETGASEAMLALVSRRSGVDRGSVAIVGAGPGAADLLTLRAFQALQEAEVIVHDRLIGPDVLDLARRDAERIDVGKARGAHRLSQDAINQLLVRLARQGKRVVRLKGGDPYVFGRGGEERAALAAAGIPVEVVPGITAATACGAAAGISLTRRGVASAVTFVTGHGEKGEPDVAWAALAGPGHTLVVYMGVSRAAAIAARLMAAGHDGATPVAVVENGTLPGERVVKGRLAGLGALVAREAIQGPAVLVIGQVAEDAVATRDFAELRLAS